MRKLLKVVLPPFTGFFVYFLAIRYSSVYFTLRIDEMGNGTIKSFMAYYRYTMPLLFVVAVLTQYLIINPVWNHLQGKPKTTKIIEAVSFWFVCLLFAIGLSYPITENFSHLIRMVGFMTAVQTIYWIIDLFILHLLTKKPQPESTTDILP